ncbi:MAG: response regulator [Pirellula sp.]|jgi:CheY-like chemotaxis protein|nr:response regulator [Pirellula sp.]
MGDTAAVAFEKSTHQSNRVSSSHSRPSVLLVDDDPYVIAAMQRNLHPYDIDLHVAFHGFQGVTEALACEPDLVITDLQMPVANGIELMQCLSHIPKTRSVPIIIITGRHNMTLSKRLRSLGVEAILEKPVSFEVLSKQISQFIRFEKQSLPFPSAR